MTCADGVRLGLDNSVWCVCVRPGAILCGAGVKLGPGTNGCTEGAKLGPIVVKGAVLSGVIVGERLGAAGVGARTSGCARVGLVSMGPVPVRVPAPLAGAKTTKDITATSAVAGSTLVAMASLPADERLTNVPTQNVAVWPVAKTRR